MARSIDGLPVWRLAGVAVLLAMTASCGLPGNGKNMDITLESAAGGDRSIGLLHGDGTHLMVAFEETPESLRVAGYSACFDFPEYEYGEEY
jgi:hypothetical protein